MKSTYLFCTKLWLYLTEIPVLAMFWITLSMNKYLDSTVKLYPLMFVLAALILFIMVYFFRYISINNDEIRCHGVFSSKDSALLSENQTLVIALHPRRNIKLELYGDAEEEPEFKWMKSDDPAHREICIFRAKAVGGKKSAARVLEYFTFPKSELNAAFSDGFVYENDTIRVESKSSNEVFNISIKLKVTIV